MQMVMLKGVENTKMLKLWFSGIKNKRGLSECGKTA
jgi:hypothetical protein